MNEHPCRTLANVLVVIFGLGIAVVCIHTVVNDISRTLYRETQPRGFVQNLEGVEMHWERLMLKEPLLRVEVTAAVKDPDWQKFRANLHGKTLPLRFLELDRWLWQNEYSREAYVQVTNYINALKRAGMIKED